MTRKKNKKRSAANSGTGSGTTGRHVYGVDDMPSEHAKPTSKANKANHKEEEQSSKPAPAPLHQDHAQQPRFTNTGATAKATPLTAEKAFTKADSSSTSTQKATPASYPNAKSDSPTDTATKSSKQHQKPISSQPTISSALSESSPDKSSSVHAKVDDKAGKTPGSKYSKDLALEQLTSRVGGLRLDKDTAGITFPPKPNAGRSGIAGVVDTNHYVVQKPAFATIYQYTLKISPQPTSARMRRRILCLLFQNESDLANAATDYRNNMVSTAPLPNGDVSLQFNVDYYGEGETGPRTGPLQTIYTVTIDPIADNSAQLAMVRMFRYFSDVTFRASYNAQPTINALNLLLNRIPNQNAHVKCLGKNAFYDVTQTNQNHARLGYDNDYFLEGFIGVYKSLKLTPRGLLMNANVTASAFYATLRADWLIDHWSGHNVQTQFNDRAQLTRFLRGVRVQARHGTRRVYTVWGIAPWGPDHWNGRRPTRNVVTFERKNKTSGEMESITVEEYFEEEYPDFPLYYDQDLVLNCGSDRDPRYLPAESLDVLPGNPYARLLDGQATKSMHDLACQRPTQNNVRLTQRLRLLGIPNDGNGDGPSQRFPLAVGSEMLAINARLLPAPTLEYNARRFVMDKFTAKGSWDLRNVRFLEVSNRQPPEEYKWAWVEFTEHGNNGSYATHHQQLYVEALRNNIPDYCPNLVQVTSTAANPFSNTANNVFASRENIRTTLKQFIKAGVTILFVILQSQNTANYETLKHVADVEIGLHTVCVVKKAKGLPSSPSAIANILMKVNLKLGGKTVKLRLSNADSAIGTLYGTKTMIVGADVTHPGPSSMRDVDSIAAVVASEDPEFARYPASIRCQTSKMEMIEQLDDMLGERLDHWRAKNGGRLYPSKIIFYRDGVSDGQFQQVLELEWPQIQSVIRRKYDAISQIHAQVVLISVQKRHHTRFYPKNRSGFEDKNGNPKPGLIVDQDVTSLDRFDWFLQSHFALLGTARPANYVVLQDQIACDVDALQKGTYWHCFTFGRSTSAISVHPAARYADLACGRARAYLREFYHAGNNGDARFDRTANAVQAWNGAMHGNMVNAMFYI